MCNAYYYFINSRAYCTADCFISFLNIKNIECAYREPPRQSDNNRKSADIGSRCIRRAEDQTPQRTTTTVIKVYIPQWREMDTHFE